MINNFRFVVVVLYLFVLLQMKMKSNPLMIQEEKSIQHADLFTFKITNIWFKVWTDQGGQGSTAELFE